MQSRSRSGWSRVSDLLRHRRWALVCAALVVAIRIGYLFAYVDTAPYQGVGGDAVEFLERAWTLSETGAYGRPHIDGQRIDVVGPLVAGSPPRFGEEVSVAPSGFRPPLWPAFLAVLLKICGGSLAGVVILRALIDGAAVLMLDRVLARSQLPGPARGLALLLFATHPTWMIYAASLLSEWLSLLLLVLLALTTLRALESPSMVRSAMVGISAGLSALCHPITLGAAAGCVALLCWRRLNRAGLAQASVALLGCALVIGPWIVRNALVLDKPGLTTSAAPALRMSWSTEFLATYDNSRAEVNLPQGEGPAYFVREAWPLVPAIVSRKLVGAAGPFVETRRAGILERGRSLWWTLSFVALPFAALFGRRLGRNLQAVLALHFLGYLALVIATYPSIRFRAPFLWIEPVAAVIVLSTMLSWRARARNPEKS